MKILIFAEGTILMHRNATGHSREEIVKQVENKDFSVKDYSSYIPVGNSPQKLAKWKQQGAEILYLTSRKKTEQINDIQNVLKKHKFPNGELLFRKDREEYKDVAERVVPDVFIEDDCESIGEDEITINHVKPSIRKKIKSILIKEFSGIDYLPDNITELEKTKIICSALIERNGRYLLVKAKIGAPRGLWNNPGGHKDKETVEDAVKREVLEETGFKVTVGKLIGTYTYNNIVKHVYEAKIIGGKLECPPNEIDSAKWFSLDEVKKEQNITFGALYSVTDYTKKKFNKIYIADKLP